LFYKPTDGRDTSLEMFNIISHSLHGNETSRNEVDSALSMSGRNSGFQALVRKKAPHIN